MTKLRHVLAIVSVLLFSARGTGAEPFRHALSLVNSPKEFGISYDFNYENSAFSTVSLTADFEGLWNSKNIHPGITAQYYNHYILHQYDAKEEGTYYFYGGFGLEGGVVADGTHDFGWMAGVGFDAGVFSVFRERFTISLEWSILAAMHMYRDWQTGKWFSGEHRAGARNAWMPVVKFGWLF